MSDFSVVFYEKEDGSLPVKDFLLSLDMKMRAKTVRTIELLQKNGTVLREPYSKSLGNGIFELRTKVGNDISRVLYFFVVGKTIVLTNRFIKKAQKTPVQEIKKAKLYRRDYLQKLKLKAE